MITVDPNTGAATSREYYHANRLGSVIAMADETGTLTAQYVYTPFGVEDAYNASGNPFRYTGRRLDAQWGIYYYRARYYDPQIGRFLETDPAWYVDSMNLYAYVQNDPVNNIDPTGMFEAFLKADFRLSAGFGGRISVEVNIDFTNGEISGAGSIGGSLGLKAKGKVVGGVRSATREGNDFDAKAEVVTSVESGEIQVGPVAGSLGGLDIVVDSIDPERTGTVEIRDPSLELNSELGLAIGGGITTDATASAEGTLNFGDTVEAITGFFDTEE